MKLEGILYQVVVVYEFEVKEFELQLVNNMGLLRILVENVKSYLDFFLMEDVLRRVVDRDFLVVSFFKDCLSCREIFCLILEIG